MARFINFHTDFSIKVPQFAIFRRGSGILTELVTPGLAHVQIADFYMRLEFRRGSDRTCLMIISEGTFLAI